MQGSPAVSINPTAVVQDGWFVIGLRNAELAPVDDRLHLEIEVDQTRGASHNTEGL